MEIIDLESGLCTIVNETPVQQPSDFLESARFQMWLWMQRWRKNVRNTWTTTSEV